MMEYQGRGLVWTRDADLQRAAASKFLCVVNDRLNAKYALAFGINLQSQLAAVQPEDRQIIGRFLDRYFPFG